MRSTILMALSIALLVPDAASACHRRYSCYGGGCYGSCSGGGCYGGCSGCHGGWSGCHGAYSGCYGGCSGCYGSGGYRAWGGGYYSNGYANNYYVYPGTTYYTPDYGVSSSRTSAYYDPNVTYGNGAINSKQARVEVILPEANDELLIQDQKINSTGIRRFFISPDLEPGKKFTYTLKMHHNVGGKVENESRTIDVQAGSIMTVDFTKPKSESFNAPTGSRSNQQPAPDGSKFDNAPNHDSNRPPSLPK